MTANDQTGSLRVQGGAECPHLPFGLCPRIWDDAHVPERLADDAAIWGDPYMAARAHWPLWLLAAAAVAALSAGTTEDKGALGAGGLLGHVAACGGCVGSYLALELFAGQTVLQVWEHSQFSGKHPPDLVVPDCGRLLAHMLNWPAGAQAKVLHAAV